MKFTKKNIIYFIKYSIIISFVIIITFFLYKEYIKKHSYDSFDDRFTNLIYYDEKNNIIDHENIEKDEQDIAKKYIDPDNVVLELGARYGTVSCVINKILNNKKNQVVVEPDEKIWNCLENNKNLNNCDFHIIKGFVSNKTFTLSDAAYASSATESLDTKINSYKLQDIESQYNLKFDTLVVDCEGCLETFFDEYPHMYIQLKNITFEEDYGHKCNYNKIKEKLVENGFVKVYETTDGLLRSMWKKN